jgi:hypothetical protein
MRRRSPRKRESSRFRTIDLRLRPADDSKAPPALEGRDGSQGISPECASAHTLVHHRIHIGPAALASEIGGQDHRRSPIPPWSLRYHSALPSPPIPPAPKKTITQRLTHPPHLSSSINTAHPVLLLPLLHDTGIARGVLLRDKRVSTLRILGGVYGALARERAGKQGERQREMR